ncbi:helix-turn-helix domain-containing protein [Desulfotomaculum nigrificans]|uniref:helix-turn-helix domain-containing protein n=1 Tax=Desulfotomaculum nigrificans TaxID=1565 RepID=UPI0001FADDEC|nr:RodZ domain-containing protein [Desulfotomaculum nigrificans]
MQIGETLRKARTEKGYSLEFLEESTKIRAKYLEALENEKFDVLPGQVYAKAFLRTYAKYLNLDVDEIMAEFNQRQNKEEPVEVSAPEPEPQINGSSKKWRYLVAGLAIVSLFAFKSYYGAGGHPEGNKPTLPKTTQQQTAENKTNQTNPSQAVKPETQGQQSVQGVRVVLKVTDNQSWMRVVADGNTVFTGMVNPGEMKDFQAQEKILLHVGNAGAVEVNVNGKDLGRLGKNGQVVQIPFAAGEVPKLTQG